MSDTEKEIQDLRNRLMALEDSFYELLLILGKLGTKTVKMSEKFEE